MLTEDEAQEVAKRFLLDKYFDAKLDLSSNQLIVKGDIQTYQLQGKITMRSRSAFDRFTGHKTANRYDFKVEIGAEQGEVINYELI